jgi:hypothetical protein
MILVKMSANYTSERHQPDGAGNKRFKYSDFPVLEQMQWELSDLMRPWHRLERQAREGNFVPSYRCEYKIDGKAL